MARAPGCLAGLPVVERLVEQFQLASGWKPHRSDGQRAGAGAPSIAELAGPVRAILAAERVALNFLQRLSGIATLTRQFVDAIANTNAGNLDTRKTIPGWRELAKYAVRCGGGRNHRKGLWDAVLIKDNHLAWLALDGCDPLRIAILAVRERRATGGRPSAVEVDTLDQLDRAFECGPDIVVVDNLGPEAVAEAGPQAKQRVHRESSGGGIGRDHAGDGRPPGANGSGSDQRGCLDPFSAGVGHWARLREGGPRPVNIALLRRLTRDAHDEYLPLAELACTLGVGASHDVDELEAFGFAIERHPYRGIAYRGPADRLCPDQIEHELHPRRVGCRIAVWNCVTSTNDIAATTRQRARGQ